MNADRVAIATQLLTRLGPEVDALKQSYRQSAHVIKSFVIDDLLPEDVALGIYRCFPRKEEMTLKRNLRQNKYVAAQMDKYGRLLEPVINF